MAEEARRHGRLPVTNGTCGTRWRELLLGQTTLQQQYSLGSTFVGMEPRLGCTRCRIWRETARPFRLYHL